MVNTNSSVLYKLEVLENDHPHITLANYIKMQKLSDYTKRIYGKYLRLRKKLRVLKELKNN